jgi:hypothetical protein
MNTSISHCVCGQHPHRVEQPAHLGFPNVFRDENQAAAVIVGWPGRELDRRMGEMLHRLDHHRPVQPITLPIR